MGFPHDLTDFASLTAISNAGRFECTPISVPRFAKVPFVLMTRQTAPWIAFLLLTWTVVDAGHVCGMFLKSCRR